MNKRFFALFFALVFLLTGCCTCDSQMQQLTERLDNLETKTQFELETQISHSLEDLLASTEYNDWLKVATNENATLAHLLRCANKCARIEDIPERKDDIKYAMDIAEALVSNKSANGEVVEVLANSKFREVWKILAIASCNDEESLIIVARKCASIEDTPERDDDIKYALDIATALMGHAEYTSRVAVELSKTAIPKVRDFVSENFKELE